MSLHRRAAQRDLNEPDIIKAFQDLFWQVQRHTAYDLDVLCPHDANHILAVEVKMLKPRGRLTKSQEALIERGWPLHIVRSVADVIDLCHWHAEEEHGD